MLFEKAGAFEKAAEIHINTKNFAQAAPLMNSITTPKLHLLYAQAKEVQFSLFLLHRKSKILSQKMFVPHRRRATTSPRARPTRRRVTWTRWCG